LPIERQSQVLHCHGHGQLRSRRLQPLRGEHDRSGHAERQALCLGTKNDENMGIEMD